VIGTTAVAAPLGCRRQQTDVVPVSARDQRRLDLQSRAELRDGSTTADEVRGIWGAPDYRSEDGSFIAYYSESISHFAGTPGFQPGLDRRYDRYFLLLKFDGSGVLQRHRTHRMRAWVAAPDVLDRIARRWGVSGPLRAMQPDTRTVAREPESQTAGSTGFSSR